MQFIDILSFCLSLYGINGLVLCFRYLLPRNATPLLSTLLNETQQLLYRAEAIGAVPPQSKFRSLLGVSANQFARMRVESHHARGTFQQLRLAFLCGLACRLYCLYYRIETVKSELELAVDEQQLTIMDGLAGTVVPSLAGATTTPTNGAIEPTLPLPATTS